MAKYIKKNSGQKKIKENEVYRQIKGLTGYPTTEIKEILQSLHKVCLNNFKVNQAVPIHKLGVVYMDYTKPRRYVTPQNLKNGIKKSGLSKGKPIIRFNFYKSFRVDLQKNEINIE